MPHYSLIPSLPDLLVDYESVAKHGGTINIAQLRGLFVLAYCEIQGLRDIEPGGNE
jgi:hypothetical protein